MSSPADPRQVAREIFLRTIAAIDIAPVIGDFLKIDGESLLIGPNERVDLREFETILVVSIGKAAVPMAAAVELVLGERITGGIVAGAGGGGGLSSKFSVFIGGHPVPNEASIEAAQSAIDLLRRCDSARTLLLFLVSGGGSALFEKPVSDAISLDDLREVNRVLVGCGAVIQEMNVVRRFLSAVKGGRLAAEAPLSRQVTLLISDVNSGDPSTISSGPTIPGPIDRRQFHAVVEKYDLEAKFPPAVSALIASGSLPDLSGPEDWKSARRTFHLLMDNRMALLAARRIAETEFDCRVEIAGDLVEGEVGEMAATHLDRARMLETSGGLACLISGGEVVCPVKGRGRGGRNQEFVLRAALLLEQQGDADLAVLSGGTDGIDGNSPAAGAVADARTVASARQAGLSPEEFLENSDSFGLFDRLGAAIITGPTGNNVRDLRVVVRGKVIPKHTE